MATIDTEQQLRDSLSDWLHTRKPFGRMHQVTLEDSPPQGGLANLLAGPPDEILRVETALRPNTDEIERLLGQSGISFSKRQLELLEENARRLTFQTPATLSYARMALVVVLTEHINPAVGSAHRSRPADFTHMLEHVKDRLNRGYGSDLLVGELVNYTRSQSRQDDMQDALRYVQDSECWDKQFTLPTPPPRPPEAEDDNDPQDGHHDPLDINLDAVRRVEQEQMNIVKSGTVTIGGIEYDLVPKKKNDRPKPQGRKIRL